METRYYNPDSITGQEAIRVAIQKQMDRHIQYNSGCLCAGCQFGDGPSDNRIVVETQYRRLYDRQELNKGIRALKEANSRIAEEKRKEAELKLKLAQEQKSRRDFDQRVNSASIKIAKVLKQHGLTFGKVLSQVTPNISGADVQHSIEFKQATVVNPLSTFLTTKQINKSK